MTPPRKPQVRLRYSKRGKVRFTSHRDMARIWERAVRKAKLPVAYSEGFSPRARLSFGLALPTVFESLAEYVDITLDERVEAADLSVPLTAALPDGVDVTGAIDLDRPTSSLQECVESTVWSMFVEADRREIDAWIAALLEADQLPLTRERKGKTRTDDVRPAIVDVAAASPLEGQGARAIEIVAELRAKPRSLRPLELFQLDSPPCTFVLGRRLHQFIAPIGARRDPLDVGAAEAPHTMSCAS